MGDQRERAGRYVGYMAHYHFGVAESPIGVMVEVDADVPVVVLGTDKDHVNALVQVPYGVERAALYVPWDKLRIVGEMEFVLDDKQPAIGFPWANEQ